MRCAWNRIRRVAGFTWSKLPLTLLLPAASRMKLRSAATRSIPSRAITWPCGQWIDSGAETRRTAIYPVLSRLKPHRPGPAAAGKGRKSRRRSPAVFLNPWSAFPGSATRVGAERRCATPRIAKLCSASTSAHWRVSGIYLSRLPVVVRTSFPCFTPRKLRSWSARCWISVPRPFTMITSRQFRWSRWTCVVARTFPW